MHTFGAPAAVGYASIIDDAAHGLPRGVPETAATITSFYATKLIGGAEGGAVSGSAHAETVPRHPRLHRQAAQRRAV